MRSVVASLYVVVELPERCARAVSRCGVYRAFVCDLTLLYSCGCIGSRCKSGILFAYVMVLLIGKLCSL